MQVRKSSVFLLFLALQTLLLAALFFHAFISAPAGEVFLTEKRALVESMKLTDLCLFTDARYTRNPSMADLNSSFQDNPMSFDHFPSGALMPVPPHLGRHDPD